MKELRTKLLCDGSTASWEADWQLEERERCVCQCCKLDCEGCYVEAYEAYDFIYDAAEPPFHGEIKHLLDDMDLCLRCKESWLNLAGYIKKVYTKDFFVPFMNEETPFLKALR